MGSLSCRVGCRAPAPSRASSFVCSSHTGVKSGKVAHHALILFLLVCVNSLSVLAKVIQPRELFRAMTRKRTLSGMFPIRKNTRKKKG